MNRFKCILFTIWLYDNQLPLKHKGVRLSRISFASCTHELTQLIIKANDLISFTLNKTS